MNNKIVKFYKLTMEKWSTQLHIKTNKGLMQSRSVKINRRIFQGDSLSPLLFCISHIPWTHE